MKQKLILSLFFSSVIALSSCTASIKVTLEFNSNGGTTIAPLTLDHGETVTIPSNPSKEGFNFGGWYWDNNVFQDPFTINSIWDRPIVDRYVVFAKWATDDSVVLPGSLTITFNSNGGTPVSSVNVQKGNTVSIPATTRTGYTLDGWYTSLNGGVTLDERWSFTSNVVNNNITLYAKWNINQYTITFDTEGGSLVNSITQDFNSNIISPQDPTKLGHSFSGWSQAIPMTMPASNITLTATWSINSYTLIFKDFDNSNLFSENYLFNSDLSTVTITDPVRVGYTFIGWNQVLPTNMPASNITIYANYRINSYTITFETNGGTSINALSLNYASAINIPPTLKTGHSFQGWFTDIGLTQAFNLTNMPSSDLILYTKWSINEYTINFETNGGNNLDSINKEFGGLIESLPSPTKLGHTFLGWSWNNESISEIIFPFEMPSNNLILYARWSVNSYFLTFETNENEEYESVLINFNESIVFPSPQKYGYKFAGWFLDPELQHENTLNLMPDRDVTLYASWNRNFYIETSMSFTYGFKLTQDGRLFASGSYGIGKAENEVDISFQWFEITDKFPLNYGEFLVSIKSGSYFALALSNLGRIFSWGRNEFGQLGLGNNTNNPNISIVEFSSLEVDEKIIEIVTGDDHSMALTNMGNLYTWGKNTSRQTGNTTTNSYVPIPFLLNTTLKSYWGFTLDETISKIRANDDSSILLTNKGRLFAFGRNGYGNLMQNSLFSTVIIPTDITSNIGLSTDERVVDFDISKYSGIILTSNQRLLTWGWWSLIGLTSPTVSDFTHIPVDVSSRHPINEDEIITKVQIEFAHLGFITNQGYVKVWGNNSSGQGSIGNYQSLLDVDEFVIDLILGSHSTTLITNKGRTILYGHNTYYQLGTGDKNHVTSPAINL
jgi:uncharacterized repeat protein (TIGR02543 family)